MNTTADMTADIQLESERSQRALQALLRGEVAAAATYEVAIARLGGRAPLELLMCLDSHHKRVERLTVRMVELGATPDERSELWGSFVRLVENGATRLGPQSVLRSLEEGEDHGHAQYRKLMNELDPESRRHIEAEILPEQMRTHGRISRLCNRDFEM